MGPARPQLQKFREVNAPDYRLVFDLMTHEVAEGFHAVIPSPADIYGVGALFCLPPKR